MTQMHSSGEERTFTTGAVRDSAAKKPMLQLISPHLHNRLGEWLRFACKDRKPKPYPERNWEKGMPFGETIGAMERHLQNYKLGLDIEDNLAAIAFGTMALMHYEEEIKAGRMDPSIDDMPKYVQRPDWETDDGRGIVIPSVDEAPFACPVCGTTCPQTEQWVMYRCPNCDWTPFDDTLKNRDSKEVGGVSSEAASALSFITSLDEGHGGNHKKIAGGTANYVPNEDGEFIICGRCGQHIVIPMDPYLVHRCARCGWTCPQGDVQELDALERRAYEVPPPNRDQERPRNLISWRCPSCHEVVWLHNDEDSLDKCPACDWIRPSDPPSCKSEPPTFYVAGPMRGYKDLNFKAFDEAAERGRQMGYNIVSPADLDREHGINPEKDPTVAEHENHLSVTDLHRIIRRDVEAIMSLQPERGDGIAVLANWTHSTGAMAEVRLAQWLGLRVILAEDFHTEVE